MKRGSYYNHGVEAEDGESLVKRVLWVILIVTALLVMQDRLNTDLEKAQQEQAALKAGSCN